MRKFAEPTQSSSVPALKKAPLRNGSVSGSGDEAHLSRAAELFTHAAASLGTSGDTSAGPRVDSTSHTSATSQSHTTPQPRGVANKPLSSANQWQNSVGGTRHPAEKDVHASGSSKEDEAPGRAAGQQVTQGEADPDMKTFLTIEIKDGRATTSSTSAPRGNIVPINNMTPRFSANAVGQKAGRSIIFTATTLSSVAASAAQSQTQLHAELFLLFAKPTNAACFLAEP